MWLAIVAAVVCFAVAGMMFTAKLRTFKYYREVAIFFLFLGTWTMLDFIAKQIWPNNTFMSYVLYIGIIVCGGLLFFRLLFTSRKKIVDMPGKKKK